MYQACNIIKHESKIWFVSLLYSNICSLRRPLLRVVKFTTCKSLFVVMIIIIDDDDGDMFLLKGAEVINITFCARLIEMP